MPINLRSIRSAKRIQLSAIFVLPLIASALLLFPMMTWAGNSVCAGNFCTYTDTTIQDFASDQFYWTSLRNSGDGEVQLLPIGVAAAWVSDAQSLPDGGRSELSAVIYHDIIYAIGGYDSSSTPQAAIYTAATTFNGPLAGPWRLADTLPSPRASAAAVLSTTSNGAFLYVLGGTVDGSTTGYTSTILYRALSADGSFSGAWQTAAFSPTNTLLKLAYLQAVVHDGYMYVLGGQDRFGQRFSDIYRAPIAANGSFGAWTVEASAIPDASGVSGRSAFVATVGPRSGSSDYLYVIGGVAGNSLSAINVPNVDFAAFNPDGSLGAFNSTAPLASIANLSGVQQGGQILLTGGNLGTDPFSSVPISGVSAALINAANGQLADLGGGTHWRASSALQQPRAYHATVANSGGNVYVLGGFFGSGVVDTVYRGAFGGAGTVYPSAGSLTSNIIDFGANYHLDTLKENSTIDSATNETITVQYRAALSTASLLAQPWTAAGSTVPGLNVTSTYTFNGISARVFQYRALFTTTAPFTHSPSLNLVELHYSLTGPDLRVAQSDNVSVAHIGDVLTYSIAYTNNDNRIATGSVLTLTPPISTVVVGTSGGWSQVGNIYRLNLGSFAANSSGSAYFVVQVTGKPASGIINSVLQIGYDNSLGNDPNPVDNVSVDSDSVAVVDLIVHSDDFKTNAVISSTNTYSVTFANTGQLNATNVVITSTIPTGTRYAGGPAWTRVSDTVWVHQVGSLPAGSNGSVNFTIFLSNTLMVGRPITHTVRIADDKTHGLDGDPANNVFSDIDTIGGLGPDLVVTSTTGIFRVGAPSVITVAVTNIGNSGTGEWFFTDVYFGHVPTNISDLGARYGTIGDLAPGATKSFTVTYTFSALGTYNIYVQADTCAPGFCIDPNYGRIPEADETNNVFGPFVVSLASKLYLPIIVRK